MVCYRICGEINLLKSTAAVVINTAHTRLTNAAAAGIKLVDDHYTKTTLADGTILLSFSIRLLSVVSRDTIKTQLNDIGPYLDTTKYSWIEAHKCYHDQTPPQPCENSITTTWGIKQPHPMGGQ